MLRRLAATAVLAGLGVGVGLPMLQAAAAPSRGAVRLVTWAGKRMPGVWQRWANASLVPTVDGRVTLRLTGCPGLPTAAGCVYTRHPHVIYVKPDLRHPRGVLLHELGHVYDLTVLSNRDRGQFRKIMRQPHRRWWAGTPPLAEWFAESYSWCARHSRIVSVEQYAIYEYDPTAKQHRDACALIKRAARDRTPPAPAPAPPIVTGDPAPPPAPPADPGVVPGDPRSDPGASVQEIPARAPRVSPTPTRTPPPEPIATPTPKPTTTPEPTPTTTPEPTATATPEPTATATPEPTATATPEPTPTETPEPTATPTPTPTTTPDPTATPTPTETPEPVETPAPEAPIAPAWGLPTPVGEVFGAPFDLPWPRSILLP